VAMHVGATLAVAREAGDEILRCAQNDRDGGESHHRLRAVPLKVNCREAAREATLGCPLTGEAKTGGAEPRPYGVYKSTEIICRAIRESPLRILTKTG
jgi:hypothetical protein